MQTFLAQEDDAGVRADIFVTSKYPEFTRSSLQLLFEKDLVSINGQPEKAAYKLDTGDKITVDERYLSNEPPKIDLPIIHEDKDVAVIDKPTGVLTHSKGALNLEGSVASFIKPKITDAKLNSNRAGIVHRLDRATSGVIITAKNAEALLHLQRQFSKRKAKKIYAAIVEGELEPKQAVINAPIGRNPAHPQTFKVGSHGKPAITEYKVLKVMEHSGKKYSFVELRPQTGRTHQLRVHMAYVNHPIVGDMVYGHGGKQMKLHAKSLELTLPGGKRKIFEAPLPDGFMELDNV